MILKIDQLVDIEGKSDYMNNSKVPSLASHTLFFSAYVVFRSSMSISVKNHVRELFKSLGITDSLTDDIIAWYFFFSFHRFIRGGFVLFSRKHIL